MTSTCCLYFAIIATISSCVGKLFDEYETINILLENFLNNLSKASAAPLRVENGVGYDLNFLV